MEKKLTVNTPKELLDKTIEQEIMLVLRLSEALEAHQTYLKLLNSIDDLEKVRKEN